MNKLLLTASLLAVTNSAYSQCNPIDSGNQSPFAAIHLQPATLAPAECQTSVRTRYSVSNNFVLRSNNNESLLIDGEITRLELSGQFQLDSEWLDSVSITLPLYDHSGGSLDSHIDGWHDLTGLPAGDRHLRPRDQISYQYQRDGNTLVDINESQNGLGDITLAAHKGRLSIAAKLPTGDEAKLTGSGGLELGAAYSKALPEAGFSGLAYSAGFTLLSDDKVLEQHYNDATASVAATAAVALGNRTNAFIGGSWQSAWYDSNIDALGSASGNIGFGLYGETTGGFWSLRLTEDLPTETAPDFGISLDYSFKL